MKNRIPPYPSFGPALATTGLMSAFFVAQANAATHTFTVPDAFTTGSDNWSTDAKWNTTPVSGSNTSLVFTLQATGNSQTQTTGAVNNIANPFQLNTMTFNSQPSASNGSFIVALNISGNPLSFVSNGPTTPVINLNGNRTSGQPVNFSVANNVVLSANTLFTGNGTASFTFSGGLSSASSSITKSGTGTLTLSGTNTYGGPITMNGGVLVLNGTHTYAGATAVNGGRLDFAGTNMNTIGGGVGVRDITVAAGSVVRRNALDNAFLNRLVQNSNEIGVMTGATANNLDFSSSTGADLPNAFLGNWASNGAKAEISGTITPGSDGYKFGAIGSSGNLGIRGAVTGDNKLTVGQTGGSGIRVTLAGAKDFTGETVINSGARLALGDNLALQNSALNVGSAGGNIGFNEGTAASTITGNTFVASPTFGGLIGSRNLSSVFTNASGNNENNINANLVTGFTLNVGTSKTHVYSGAIGGFGTGTTNVNGGGINGNSTLSKTGLGTQVFHNATHTYTGATSINGGTLMITGTGSINSTSSITVGTGAELVYNSSTALTPTISLSGNGISDRAILGGSGTISSALTLDNVGDTLSPGNSPGIMTFTTDQSWLSFSYDWEINDFTGLIAGTSFDQLDLDGSLTLTGGPGAYILNIISLTALNAFGEVPNFSETSTSWTILTTANGITGFNAGSWSIDTSGFSNDFGGTWSISEVGNDLVLFYAAAAAAVPEPGTALLVAFGSLVLLRRKR